MKVIHNMCIFVIAALAKPINQARASKFWKQNSSYDQKNCFAGLLPFFYISLQFLCSDYYPILFKYAEPQSRCCDVSQFF